MYCIPLLSLPPRPSSHLPEERRQVERGRERCDRKSLLALTRVLQSSHIRTLCLPRFGSRFLSSIQHFRWVAATNARCCGGQGLPPQASGRLTDQHPLEPVTLPATLEKHWRPRNLQKATSPLHPPLAGTLGPHPSSTSSSAAIQLLHP